MSLHEHSSFGILLRNFEDLTSTGAHQNMVFVVAEGDYSDIVGFGVEFSQVDLSLFGHVGTPQYHQPSDISRHYPTVLSLA